MADTKMELSEARVRLAALVEARSKANCSSHHSSEADMRREAEIEDVEERIAELEKELAS